MIEATRDGHVLTLEMQRPERRNALNAELVDAQPISDQHLERVQALLTKHLEETGSSVAATLLELDPEQVRARFTPLVPRDYARVLKARAEAEAAGLDEETTVKLMMEASHG